MAAYGHQLYRRIDVQNVVVGQLVQEVVLVHGLVQERYQTVVGGV